MLRKKAISDARKTGSMLGYRVQVFSGNDRTAKTTAYKIEERIRSRQPNYTVYVSFASPFWKVRIGDCVTSEEAQLLRNEVRKAFPEYSNETYVVREQIFIPE